jgi:hypothetical protein
MLLKYFIRNDVDTLRLAEDGTLAAAHACTPQYFDDERRAYMHPLAEGMVVDAVPAVETIPGAGVEADFAIAADTYDAVISPDVYHRVAADVAAIAAGWA